MTEQRPLNPILTLNVLSSIMSGEQTGWCERLASAYRTLENIAKERPEDALALSDAWRKETRYYCDQSGLGHYRVRTFARTLQFHAEKAIAERASK